MSLRRKTSRDPARVAAKRAARREAIANGATFTPRQRPSAQMNHASSAKAVKKAREGEAKMERWHG